MTEKNQKTTHENQRIALVTGASRGIGYAVAKRLAQEGVHIIATGRTVGALEQLDDEIFELTGSNITISPLDICDGNAVDMMAASIHDRFGKLDILVGCAGILGKLAPTAHYSPKQFETIVATNMTANWRLLRTFDAMLRQSENGRAIFITSNVSCDGRAFWSAYGASKAGLESLVKTYAQEVENISDIKANLINPGKVATALRTEAYPGEDATTLPTADSITDIFVKLISPNLKETGHIFYAQ